MGSTFSIACIPFYALVAMILRSQWNVIIPLMYFGKVIGSVVSGQISEVDHGGITVRAYQVASALLARHLASCDEAMKAGFVAACSRRWVVNLVLVLYSFFFAPS